MTNAFSIIGKLEPSVISERFTDRVIDFIWQSLIPWEGDPDRPLEHSEQKLNSSLHAYLSSRASDSFPMVTFAHEEPQRGQRMVDLAVKPSSSINISGYNYTKYEPILVIECKRLPAPSTSREQEYVSGKNGQITGGIQRFKFGEHGELHKEAIIIGYIQQKDHQYWFQTINGWISELSISESEIWGSSELLTVSIINNKVARFFSDHSRTEGCCSPTIKLHHFWIIMNTR